jgi:hypothetical protein
MKRMRRKRDSERGAKEAWTQEKCPRSRIREAGKGFSLGRRP